MKAVVMMGGFGTRLRPLTLTLPAPMIDFCNKPLMQHQLEALSSAGCTEVILCVHERVIPKTFYEKITEYEQQLKIKIQCSVETRGLGTAGPIKLAEKLITNEGSSNDPFFVINSDVLCSFPLRDLVHVHMKHGREATVLTTTSKNPSQFGVVVTDEETGQVLHFVDKPETFLSDKINAGVYVFNPSFFKRIAADEPVSMNVILPQLATEGQFYAMNLQGYWVKLSDCFAYRSAVGPQLEILKLMGSPLGGPTKMAEGKEYKGNVLVDPTATIGEDCCIGPNVVVGPGVKIEDGCRLEDTTLFAGATVQAHSKVKGTLVGWNTSIGKWCWVQNSIFGEEVHVKDGLLVNGATVLPHKDLIKNIRTEEIVI